MQDQAQEDAIADQMDLRRYRCWICASSRMKPVRPSKIVEPISSRDFAITDANYGKTGAMYLCQDCGFLECPELEGVLDFYTALVDEQYEATGEQRKLQAHHLLKTLRKFKPDGRLLDIGAGSGHLLAEAVRLGYEAEGVEPSTWLHEKSVEKGLKVHLGVLPHPDVKPPFDAVTVVDVIEHVSAPVQLLNCVREIMDDRGVGLLVCPDVGSLTARLMGDKWWHYRVAHIGYFTRTTLLRALNAAGLKPMFIGRPWWYLDAEYLAQRANQYLPTFLRFHPVKALRKLTVPINLFDSLLVVFRCNS